MFQDDSNGRFVKRLNRLSEVEVSVLETSGFVRLHVSSM